MKDLVERKVNHLGQGPRQNQPAFQAEVLKVDQKQIRYWHHTFAQAASDDVHSLVQGTHRRSQNVYRLIRLLEHKTP